MVSGPNERRVASLEVGERAEEEAWKESVRRYDEKRRVQARYEWHLYHTSQAERHRRTLETLIAHHETRAAGLAKLGKPRLDDGPDAAA